MRQEGDSGTLYHIRARYYDAAAARFLSPDPIWPQEDDPLQINPYAYAGANPVGFVDVTGLQVERLDLEDWVEKFLSGEKLKRDEEKEIRGAIYALLEETIRFEKKELGEPIVMELQRLMKLLEEEGELDHTTRWLLKAIDRKVIAGEMRSRRVERQERQKRQKELLAAAIIKEGPPGRFDLLGQIRAPTYECHIEAPGGARQSHKMHIFAGRAVTYTNALWVYDIASNSWVLPSPRVSAHKLSRLGQRLWLMHESGRAGKWWLYGM